MTSIDMRSDTVTKPTEEMRRAMMNAEVDDDVYSGDPTAIRLQEKMAAMLGKESGLFFPSGTMANLTSLMVHADRRGDEVILGDRSHIGMWEQGGVAQIAGIFPRQVRNLPDGTLDLEELQGKIFYGGRDGHNCCTRLVCIENTQNYCGGRAITTDYMEELYSITSSKGIKIHVDGARLFNAATALKVEASELVKRADSVSICLSKGLGAPVGSLVVGSKEFIDRCHRVRKVLGGGMRQVGVLAAAGIVAIDSILPLLEEDHKNAKLFARLLSGLDHLGLKVDLDQVQTNMILLHIDRPDMSSHQMVEKLEHPSTDKDCPVVKISVVERNVIRAVTHHQISRDDVEKAAARIKQLLEGKC